MTNTFRMTYSSPQDNVQVICLSASRTGIARLALGNCMWSSDI
jgi:hypothetical protein